MDEQMFTDNYLTKEGKNGLPWLSLTLRLH